MEVFREDLLKDEELLWTGQPEITQHFTGADIFLVPFSLMWGGFAFFWEAMVLAEIPKGIPIAFPLFGTPFVIIGIYFIFGRFVYKKAKKRNTFYAVTNKRVLTLTKMFGRNLKAAFIDKIPSINKSIRSNGIGSIRFGNTSFFASMYGNTGMDFFGSFYGDNDVPTFYDIKDADKVFSLVNDLRNK